MPSLDDLSKKRSSCKSKITKLVNKIDPLLKLNGKDAVLKADQVKTLLGDLDNALVSFNETQQSYIDKVETDGGEVGDEQEAYIDAVLDKYYSAKELYPGFIKVCSDCTKAMDAIPDREDSSSLLKLSLMMLYKLLRLFWLTSEILRMVNLNSHQLSQL